MLWSSSQQVIWGHFNWMLIWWWIHVNGHVKIELTTNTSTPKNIQDDCHTEFILHIFSSIRPQTVIQWRWIWTKTNHYQNGTNNIRRLIYKIKRKPPCIGGMELVSLSCNCVFISAESVGRGWCKIAIATKWYQFHTTDKCGFLFMPWITDQLYISAIHKTSK